MMRTNKKMLMTTMMMVMLGLGMTSLAVLKNVGHAGDVHKASIQCITTMVGSWEG